MLKEITPKSRIKVSDSMLTVSQLAIINPLVILDHFKSDNRVVLGPDMEQVLDRLDPRLKAQLIAMDEKRREREEFRKTRGQYSCSSELNLNNYNNRYAREFIGKQLLFGI